MDLVHSNFSVSLSIVSHGQGYLVRNLLRDLAQQRDIAFDIILTINIYEDEEFLKEFDKFSLKIIRNEFPKGFGANHNSAFKLCETKWFVVLNPDIRLTSQLALHDLFSDVKIESTHAALVAPLVVNQFGVIEDSVRLNLTPWSIVGRKIGLRQKVIRQSVIVKNNQFLWFAGMALALRVDVYKGIGGFDEHFFMYCEDYDLCARIYMQGYSMVFNDRAVFIHDAQRDSHRSVKHLWWHIISLAKVWVSSVYWHMVLRNL